jgi:hypothetical protein
MRGKPLPAGPCGPPNENPRMILPRRLAKSPPRPKRKQLSTNWFPPNKNLRFSQCLGLGITSALSWMVCLFKKGILLGPPNVRVQGSYSLERQRVTRECNQESRVYWAGKPGSSSHTDTQVRLGRQDHEPLWGRSYVGPHWPLQQSPSST